MKSLVRLGWPVMLGALALAIGILCLMGAALIERHAGQVEASFAQRDAVRDGPNSLAPRGVGLADSNVRVPPYSSHLLDVRRIFELAKEQGVTIGAVDYRSEPRSAAQLLVRSVDLRVNEEYPKFKLFVADLLKTFPHLYVQEIRIEKPVANAPKVQTTLKLSLVYQSVEGAAGRSEPAAIEGPEVARLERLRGTVSYNAFGPINPAATAPGGPSSAALATLHAAAVPTVKARDAKPPEPPAQPPPPSAPPLPFVAVGAVQGAEVTNGKQVAFIRQQDQVFVIHAGDTIRQTYRVESITSQQIEFTYLPLMQRQTLALAP